MTQEDKAIEIPFGAKDSELLEWVYFIPEGMEAEIKDRKVIIKKAESEDERIRKSLLAYIKGESKRLDTQKWIAYLEKQKDIEDRWIEDREQCFWNGVEEGKMLAERQKENPKSADSIPSDCTSDAKCEDRWHKVGDSLPDNPREVLCKDAAGNYFIGRYYSDEGWEISNYDDEDKPNDLNPPVAMWIDFPSEKQKEQKPAEWSEEDELTIAELINYFEGDPLERSIEEMVQRIKSLRPQPHWKPSEKQMKALDIVVSDYRHACTKGSDEKAEILKSLLEQLQKL